ncbi:hypothetical protein NMD1_03959 [Novosphingobium sp. MD-1]|nr:hypothetical protein NMD1_03959 [Novosphingobium sp. MD-1]
MMGATARLHRYQARRLPGEEVKQPGPAQLPAENGGAALVGAVGMKNVLRDIQTNRGNL